MRTTKSIALAAAIGFLVLTFGMRASAAPPAASAKVPFTVTAGQPFAGTMTVSQAGCVLVQVPPWSAAQKGDAAASSLTLTLASSNKTWARADGSATASLPLWTSALASGRSTWSVGLANNTKVGSAAGTMTIDAPSNSLPCEFKATPSRTRGQVDLSWSYAGSGSGSFLVERSTNGSSWRVLSACTQSVSQSTFKCSDTGLSSGATVLYRACVVSSGSVCGTTSRTPSLSVKAP